MSIETQFRNAVAREFPGVSAATLLQFIATQLPLIRRCLRDGNVYALGPDAHDITCAFVAERLAERTCLRAELRAATLASSSHYERAFSL